jgi:tagatose-1,6-bisphosphate aldolase
MLSTKIKFLKSLIEYSKCFSSLEDFVKSLNEMHEDMVERYEKETRTEDIANTLSLLSTEAPGSDVHTYNKAKMYLNIELKKD